MRDKIIMEQLFIANPMIPITLTIIIYVLSCYISTFLSKIKLSIFSPIVISMIFLCLFLKIFDVSYATYNEGAKFITYLAVPATLTLALQVYRRKKILKENYVIIFISISIGILFGFISTFLFARYAFNLDYKLLISLLSKSITTPIAIELTDKLGGIQSVTILAVFISGIIGASLPLFIYKLFRIKSPLAQGLGLGNSSHAVGTAKAMTLGTTEGAMSSLALTISGIISIIFIPLLIKLFAIIF